MQYRYVDIKLTTYAGLIKTVYPLNFLLNIYGSNSWRCFLKTILQHFKNHRKKALETESYFKFKYRSAPVTLLNCSIRTIILIEWL